MHEDKINVLYYKKCNKQSCRKKTPIILKIDGSPYLEEFFHYWILGPALVRILCFEIRKLEKCNEIMQ